MNITRCTVGQNKCSDLETLATPNVCKSINMPNTLWAEVVKSVKPSLGCPLRKVNTNFYSFFLSKANLQIKKIVYCIQFINWS